MIRIVQSKDGVIAIVSPRGHCGEWVFINDRPDSDGELVGCKASNPDDWADLATVIKELSAEQVDAVFKALEEVFNEM